MNENGIDPVRLDRLRAVLTQEVEAGRLPGAVVAISRRGRAIAPMCVGRIDPARETPMRSDAIFRIYSMTKPMVSVAALMLMEEGRLQLAEPVETYLPEFRPSQVCNGRNEFVALQRLITIYDLLTHTSGLVYGDRGAPPAIQSAHAKAGLAGVPRDMTAGAFLTRLAQCPLAFQPGSCWGYGHSTDVLGILIERLCGERLSQHLDRRIFKPLGLTDTAFQVSTSDLSRVAEPHPTDPMTGEPRVSPSHTFEPTRTPALDSGGAGALSTAADYLRFCGMLLGQGMIDGVRLLAPSSVRLMVSNHLSGRIAVPLSPAEASFGSPGYGFGLGVGVRLEHGCANVPGSPGDYYWGGSAGTFFWVDPLQDLAVVQMAQTPGPLRQRNRRLVRQLVYQALLS